MVSWLLISVALPGDAYTVTPTIVVLWSLCNLLVLERGRKAEAFISLCYLNRWSRDVSGVLIARIPACSLWQGLLRLYAIYIATLNVILTLWHHIKKMAFYMRFASLDAAFTENFYSFVYRRPFYVRYGRLYCCPWTPNLQIQRHNTRLPFSSELTCTLEG
jgi:hypothetical protein